MIKIFDVIQSVQTFFKSYNINMQLEPTGSLSGYFLFLIDNTNTPVTFDKDVEDIDIKIGVMCIFQSPVQAYKEYDRYAEIIRTFPKSIPIKDDAGTVVCNMEISDTNGCQWNHQFGTVFANVLQLTNYQGG